MTENWVNDIYINEMLKTVTIQVNAQNTVELEWSWPTASKPLQTFIPPAM